MSENEPPQPESDSGHVECRRTGQSYAPSKHERCPYCFGTAADVVPCAYENFCDFQPGRDPISFGFPEDGRRFRTG